MTWHLEVSYDGGYTYSRVPEEELEPTDYGYRYCSPVHGGVKFRMVIVVIEHDS